MTIRQTITEINRQLSGQYPATEIDSFIHILFRHYCNMSSVEIHLQCEKKISDTIVSEIMSALDQLIKHRPIQYILGETEFYGFKFEVSPDVLIPRPETEELVDWVIHEYDKNANLSMVDIGTGSGCIAVALAACFSNADIWAIDNSESALSVAQRNACKNKVKINFFPADILKDNTMEFHPESLDVVVSNPPYITPAEQQMMHPNVLEYEPHSALFVLADDPLIFYRLITVFASKYLKDRGRLFFEINEKYPCEVSDMLKQYNFRDITVRKDINGKWRMVSALK